MKPFIKSDEAAQDINPAGSLQISLDDDHKFDVKDYRGALYDELKKLRRDTDPGARLNRFFYRGAR